MKILLYSHTLLYPILTGRELRIFHVWKLMAKRHEVHLICQTAEEPSRDSLDVLDNLFASSSYFLYKSLNSQPNRYSIFKIIRDIYRPPLEDYSLSAYDDAVREAIEKKVKEEKIDIVYTYGLSARRYAGNLQKAAVVYDIGDDPTVLHFRLMREKKGLINKLRAVKAWLTARNFEKNELSKLKNVVIISFDDAKVHRRLCPANNITILPNGVDAEFFKTTGKSLSDEPVVMFSGVMDYEPNISAAQYLCREIFPLIKKEVPEAVLYIVGRYPGDRIKALDDERSGITVTGAVADIREYFNKTQVYICPLRSGAGIKNKILEAWAMETPVVATPLSCEGIEVAVGKDILVGETAEKLARQTIILLKDKELRKQLAYHGRRKVEEKYSWESRCDILDELFNKLIRKN